MRASIAAALAALMINVQAAGAAEPAAPAATVRSPTLIEVPLEDLLARLRGNGTRPFLLDVRSVQEFAAGHLPGAVNIPLDQLASRASEVAGITGSDVIVYCLSGARSRLAIEVLRAKGVERPLYHFGGGYAAWQAANESLAPTE